MADTDTGVPAPTNQTMPLVGHDYGTSRGYGPGKDKGISLDDGVDDNDRLAPNNDTFTTSNEVPQGGKSGR